MENWNTILIDFQAELADGRAERPAALAMVQESLRSRVRWRKIWRGQAFSEIDARAVQHRGYGASQWIRKRVERDLRLDEDHRRAASHPLSQPPASPDARLPE